jgi:type I restriction enzyme R subunit
MDPRRLYESPFTDVDDQGVSGVFTPTEVKILVETLAQVRAKAIMTAILSSSAA